MNVSSLFSRFKTEAKKDVALAPVSNVAVLTEIEAEPVTPVKSPVVLDQDACNMSEYKALAKELGLQLRALSALDMKEFLAEEGIHAYNQTKVREYMDAITEKERKARGLKELKWVWKPLRESDSAVIKSGWNHGGISFSETVYPHEIPYPVLLTIKKLTDRFGDRVVFHVSDYNVPDPDPFLMVSIDTWTCFVVERWDEPSFRG